MIFAFCGQKGGSGKTTAAICIAAEFHRRGQATLLVDTDPQATSLTWSAVAAEKEISAPSTIAMQAGLHRPDQLPRVARSYDHVVIDTPPRMGDVQRSVLMAADIVILPCGPTLSDTWALGASLELVTEAQTLRPGLIAAVLITKKKPRTTLGKGAREALSNCGVPVLRAELTDRVAYQEFIGTGQGVTEYAPRDVATGEVRALVIEILKFAKVITALPKSA